jgi:peptidoglycan/xylan/chitin deacetylase (PgdA/CDA1 family)
MTHLTLHCSLIAPAFALGISCLSSHAQEPAPPPAAQAVYTCCRVDKPVVALTFDDGPTAALTPKLLDILKANQVKATLFVIGKSAAQHPELLQRAVAEGHEIGNHTWSHANLTKVGLPEARAEIQNATDAISKATGKSPVVMRPPFLAINDEVAQMIRGEFGMKIISTNVDSLDWRDRNADKAREIVVEKTAPGAIILCHESQPTTIDALPEILKELKAKGYRFVTVSELVAMDQPAASENKPQAR